MAHKKGHPSYGGPGQKKMEDVPYVDLSPEDKIKRKGQAALNRAGAQDPKRLKQKQQRTRRHAKMFRAEEMADLKSDTKKDVLKAAALETVPILIGGGIGKAVSVAARAKRAASAAKAAKTAASKAARQRAAKTQVERKATKRMSDLRQQGEKELLKLDKALNSIDAPADSVEMAKMYKYIHDNVSRLSDTAGPKKVLYMLRDNIDPADYKKLTSDKLLTDDAIQKVLKKYF